MSDIAVSGPKVSKANAGLFRTNMIYNAETIQKVHMIRVETRNDGTEIEIDAWLPVGNGWNQGHPGSLDWQNLNVGWRSYDEYMAEKHSKEVTAKRTAEKK